MEKTLVQLLEETYTELANQETKYGELKSKLEQVLEMFYIQNTKEFIDDLECVNIFKSVLSGSNVSSEDVSFKAAKELTNFIFIKCKKRADKSLTFDYVNSANPKTKNRTSSKFDNGLTPQFFIPNSFYLVFCDKKFVWHWAIEVDEVNGLKINNKFKTLCAAKGV